MLYSKIRSDLTTAQKAGDTHLVGVLYFIWRNQNRAGEPAFAVSTPVMLATPTPLPVMTATLVPTAMPGNIWVVMSIEESALYSNGFYYDVATFYNLAQPTLTVRAQCMIPSWPSPEIGHQFVLIYETVLVPVEGVESEIQRFLILDDGL